MAAVSGCRSHLPMSSPIFSPMDSNRLSRLIMLMVSVVIVTASIFSGDSEPALERMCTTHASASACRRI
jgi:hypothetical protein